MHYLQYLVVNIGNHTQSLHPPCTEFETLFEGIDKTQMVSVIARFF